MIKMTIATDARGKLIGAVRGHTLASKDGQIEAKVSFAEGHKLHKVEVEDDMEKITDSSLFQERLVKHLPKS